MVNGVPYFLATIQRCPDGRERLLCRGADDTSLEYVDHPIVVRAALHDEIKHGISIATLRSWGMVWG